ncbi:hypothetical protein AOCH_004207 [Aspergillus ochraceoroseus]|uniref:Uncharacterized protein n=1 Tax=Aspergillus ochraceoroseus TaxID=138278 RepID=A0A0F8UEN2_9EURO|nr:hypothetical protein AOCH_004207 [Aspergillus ochraceoroseus]
MANDENRTPGSTAREADPILLRPPPGFIFPLTHQNQDTQNTNPTVPPTLFYTGRPLVISRTRQPAPRQNYCYHSTVTRQWRIDEYETCDSCGRIPFLKWFYLCTEDTSGYLDPIDPEGSLLSPWITDAILSGEYTNEQKEIIIQQKLKVLRLCEKQRSPSPSSLTAQPDENGVPSCHTPAFLAADAPGAGLPQSPPAPARCSYKACQHCERRLQERTWVSLNEVCNEMDANPPSSAWDLWDRPVSDFRIVRNLGLRSPNPPPPPPHLAPHVPRNHRLRSRHHTRSCPSFDVNGLQGVLSTIDEGSEEIEIRSSGVFTDLNLHDLDTASSSPLMKP